MFDKKGAHYGLQVFTRSRNYFTLYKSAGAFDKKGTDAAGRWRASGRITVGTCRSRHSDRDIISAVCSGDWCGRSDVLCRYGDRYQRTESMRKGIFLLLHSVEYWYRLRVDLLRHICSIGRG